MPALKGSSRFKKHRMESEIQRVIELMKHILQKK